MLQEQMAKSKKPKVRLVVFWADEAYESSITIPKKLWEEIKNGKKYEKKAACYPDLDGDGPEKHLKYHPTWIFNSGGPDEQLKVWVEKKNPGHEMDVFIGSLSEVYAKEVG